MSDSGQYRRRHRSRQTEQAFSADDGPADVAAAAAPPPVPPQPSGRRRSLSERRQFSAEPLHAVSPDEAARPLRSPKRLKSLHSRRGSRSRASSNASASRRGRSRRSSRRHRSRVSITPQSGQSAATPHTPRDWLEGWARSALALPFADTRRSMRIRMVPEGRAAGRPAPFSEARKGMLVRVWLQSKSDPLETSGVFVGTIVAKEDEGVVIVWNEADQGGPPDDGPGRDLSRPPRQRLIPRDWWDGPGRAWWFGERYEARVLERSTDKVLVRWQPPELGGPPAEQLDREQWVSREWWDGDGRPTTYEREVIRGAAIDPVVDTLTIHYVDCLAPDTNVVHPVVRWHLIDGATGQVIDPEWPKTEEPRPEEVQRRDKVASAGAGGQFTKPFDLRTGQSSANLLRPVWEQSFTGSKEGLPDLQELAKSHPDALVLFEVLDFWYEEKVDIQRQYIRDQFTRRRPLLFCVGGSGDEMGKGYGRGHGYYYYPICWAFLKLSGTGASCPKSQNITKSHRLQLYRAPQHRGPIRELGLRLWPRWVYPNAAIATTGRALDAEHDLLVALHQGATPPIFATYNDPINRLDKYPGSLYVTLHRRQRRTFRLREKRPLRERKMNDELDRRLQQVRQETRRQWAHEATDVRGEDGRDESEALFPFEDTEEAGAETIDAAALKRRCLASSDGPPLPPLDPLDADGKQCRQNLQAALSGGKRGCLAIAFSPCGAFLALAACDDGVVTVRVHDALYGPDPSSSQAPPEGADSVRLACPCIALFEGHTETVYQLVWSPDGRGLMSASADGTARVWDFGALPKFDWADYHTTQQLALCLAPGGGGAPPHLALPRCGKSMLCLLHPCRVYCAAYHPAGNVIMTGGFDEMLRCWSTATGQLLQVVEAASGSWIASMTMEYSAYAMDPVDPRLFTADGSGQIRVWRFSGARTVGSRRLPRGDDPAAHLEVSPIDSMAIRLFEGKRISHMEACPRRPKMTGTPPDPYVGLRTQITAQALWSRVRLPKGREADERLGGVVTQVSRDEITFQLDKDELSRDDLESGEWEDRATKKITREDWRAGFDRAEENAKLFVWTAADSCATCIDLKRYAEEGSSGKEIRRFRGRGFENSALRGGVSKDGGIVCTGSATGHVFFWDARKAKNGQPCELGHNHTGRDVGLTSPVFAVAWSPCDHRVAFATYGSRLNQVTVWCRAPNRDVSVRRQSAEQEDHHTRHVVAAEAVSREPVPARPALSVMPLPSSTGVAGLAKDTGDKPRSPGSILSWWQKQVTELEAVVFKKQQRVLVALEAGDQVPAEIVRWGPSAGYCTVRFDDGEQRQVPSRMLLNPPRAGPGSEAATMSDPLASARGRAPPLPGGSAQTPPLSPGSLVAGDGTMNSAARKALGAALEALKGADDFRRQVSNDTEASLQPVRGRESTPTLEKSGRKLSRKGSKRQTRAAAAWGDSGGADKKRGRSKASRRRKTEREPRK
eukprot:TRINITY_DN19263_c0_g1_i1.p1 TRINITY_DN19263_c0_g1~~TRINITY_DN19263_c0_g1_i1.p1  ORF type:complete len:1467 (+),score=303.95 TRINITY_DN19263_c0_g1_i1:51-4451(+)